jgi:uncharacterized cupredoxin-like copper-binding protein
MHRKRLTLVGVVLGAGLAAWAVGLAAGPASGQVKAQHAPKVTVVTVTAGKPSELAFKLSKSSLIPVGTVTFKVTNQGLVGHTFEICTSPSANSKPNSCKGKVTPMLQPGKSASITVTLKKGTYEFVCTLPGHANAGMKGLLGIGVKVAATPVAAATPTSTPTTPSGSSSTPAAKPCNSPQPSTVNVVEFEWGFTVSPTTVPCGPITFNQSNTGTTAHDFVIENLLGGAGQGSVITPGQTTTMTVTLTPAVWNYNCDIPTHKALGMLGSLTVTG